MKHISISSAVAAACMVMGSGAHALALSGYSPNADTLEFRISGASAQDIALEKALASVCDPGTLNGASQLNQAVYYCSITPNVLNTYSGLTVFTNVATTVNKLVVYKSSLGGSGNGATPVATGATNIQFLNLATIAANPSYLGATTLVTSAILPSYTMQAVVASATSLVTTTGTPVAGLTDVEPSLLGVSAANQALLTRTEGAHLAFGVPVTKTLRDQLQTAQGLVSGSELPADQPNLSTPQLSAIYNGSITDFADIGVPTGPVNLAIRSAGSGTTRATNAYFGLDSPGQCVLNVKVRRTATTLDTSGSSCTTDGVVMWGGGTDNVFACLSNHEAGSRRAIGVSSLETSTTAGTAGASARFIKVDGNLPTLLNVINGRYGLWASVSYNIKASLTGDQLAAALTFRSLLSDRDVIKDVNLTITQTFASAGDVGYLLAPSATNLPSPLPFTTLPANLTNAFTKVSGSQNNCLRGLKYN